MSGFDGSTPPIVYDELVMFVCGGSTICFSVCSGVVILARNARIRAGRHLRAAAESSGPPPARAPNPCCGCPFGCVPAPPTPAFWRHACICANSAAVGGLIRRNTSSCCPPVFTFATIFGTRSEEHTSELQSRGHLVCRLLLEKKKYSRPALCIYINRKKNVDVR